jgi:cytoskeletal protein RodZ
MIDSKIKTFTNLKELGDFLKENRELQNIKIEDASKLLLIKKNILDKFEKGEVNIEQTSYLKGFLNSYIKFLKLENLCILKFTETKKFSKLEKSNLQLESSELKKNKYSSIVILLSLIAISFTYLLWNKKTYLNLYLIGSHLN